MSLEYQIGQVVYSKSGHDQGDVQMICAIEGEYLLLADGRRRKLEKPKRKKKKHVQPTFYVEKDVAAKLQDRKSTRLNSSHSGQSRMPSSA